MMGAAASRLDAWIIAEGVELFSELDELVRLKVPLVQGYLLGRPDPGMEALPASVAEMLRARLITGTGPTLQGHVSACETFWTRELAGEAMAANPGLREALVVDVWQRPIELFHRHAVAGVRSLRIFMKTQVESSPAEVLQRALTREEALRFDPVVVIGAEGATVGIVSIDVLMRAQLSAWGGHVARS